MSVFDDMMDGLHESIKVDTGTVLLALIRAANGAGMKAKANSTGVEISAPSTPSQSNYSVGFYDMKPAFQNSSKVKFSKATHEWYLRVPIRRKVKSMNSNLYKQARGIGVGTTQKLDNLLNEREETMSPFGQLPSNLNTLTGQQDLSGNLTRLKNPNGRGSTYIAFRTVSANSPANSWIVKYNTDTEELDETQSIFDKIVEGV